MTFTRSATCWGCPRTDSRDRAGHRRRIRRPRGHVHSTPAGALRLRGAAAGEDGLHPRGVHHPHRQAPSLLLSHALGGRQGRAAPGCGYPGHRRCRRLPVHQHSGAHQCHQLLRGALPGAGGQGGQLRGVHQQRYHHGHARLRRHAAALRRRAADGPPGREAGPGPGGDPYAQSAGRGRHLPPRQCHARWRWSQAHPARRRPGSRLERGEGPLGPPGTSSGGRWQEARRGRGLRHEERRL